jgi:NADP-dependent 3-hydroxy acid dehydrogenase YdfG
MTTERLDETVALVTGASSGIGEATALRLSAEGATVVLVARRIDRLKTLAEKIESAGGRALSIECDVADREQAAAAVAQTVEQFGRLDTLVNNAGVMLLGPIENANPEDWERMIGVNVDGLLACTHAALPHLLKSAEESKRQVADIVNLSSTAGRIPRVGSGVYNLVKHGIGAFSESLRQEVTSRFVRVTLIEPGVVDTELKTHLSPAAQEALKQRFAGIEPLRAEDIADTISYVVTRNRRIALNEILMRPTPQDF